MGKSDWSTPSSNISYTHLASKNYIKAAFEVRWEIIIFENMGTYLWV